MLYQTSKCTKMYVLVALCVDQMAGELTALTQTLRWIKERGKDQRGPYRTERNREARRGVK